MCCHPVSGDRQGHTRLHTLGCQRQQEQKRAISTSVSHSGPERSPPARSVSEVWEIYLTRGSITYWLHGEIQQLKDKLFCFYGCFTAVFKLHSEKFWSETFLTCDISSSKTALSVTASYSGSGCERCRTLKCHTAYYPEQFHIQ